MAKINISLDVDWLDENENLDNVILQAITKNIADKLSEKVLAKIEKEATKQINEKLSDMFEKKFNELTDSLLNKKTNLYDKWGDLKEENVSVMDILKKRLDSYLAEKVDDRGFKSEYSSNNNMTRLDYCISKNIDYEMKNKIDRAVTKIREGIMDYLQKEVEGKLGKEMAKAMGINIEKALK